MADKKAKDLQKELHKRLERLLQKEENRLCFDCHEKGWQVFLIFTMFICAGPRWASMNLGIFICLRCAGIHRALGVHISKGTLSHHKCIEFGFCSAIHHNGQLGASVG